jgi:hemerythrin-like domain-containing protein
VPKLARHLYLHKQRFKLLVKEAVFMQIYDVLMKDHDEVKLLLRQLIGLGEQEKEARNALVQKVQEALVPHARAEEAVLYNSLRAEGSAKELTRESYKEHLGAEALLRFLQLKDATFGDWKKTAEKLLTALEHHILNEETKVFAAAREVFTSEESEMMTKAFQKLKGEMANGSLGKSGYEMVANLMPPRFSSAINNPIQERQHQNETKEV